MKKVLGTMVLAILALGLMTGCPDDTDDCASDPSLCDGDTDTDADADADGDRDDVRPDGDVPVEYGTLTVTSTPVAGAEVQIDGAVDPRCSTTPCELELPVGTHDIHLSFPGRLQAPSPAEVNVTTIGTNVNIVLYRELIGRWREETYDWEDDWRVEIQPPDSVCPDTWVRVIGVNPMGTFCVEADDSLSLCKNYTTSGCARDTFVEGHISADGRQVEFDACLIADPTACDPHMVYVKLD